MGLQQRLGNFLLIVGLISLFIFWADFFTSGAIEHFAPLVVGVLALWWGGSLRTRGRPSAEADDDEPPPPKPAPAAKTGSPLSGLLKPKAKAKPAPAAAPKPAAPPPPPPKKGLAGLLAPRKKK